jgi:hypothetical protein
MRTTDVWKRVLKGSLLVLALMIAGNVPSMAQDSGSGFLCLP